jgi:hypothetical protein
MRTTAVAFSMLLAVPALTGQNAATYSVYGTGCAGTGAGMGACNVAPAAFATTFMPSNNTFGFSGSPQKYQQVFLSSELPSAFTMNGLGLRWDNQNTVPCYGALVDLEIQIGYTTKDPMTLSTTFAANFDSGAPVTVLPRSNVSFPDMLNPPATDPTVFQVVIPFTNTFAWAPQAGRNLLIQVIQRGSSSGSAFVYVLDCGWSTGTARLYGADTDTVGHLDGFAYGYAMCFKALTNTALPVLTVGDLPQFGNQLPVNLAQATPSSFSLLTIGLSSISWNGTPLPLDLATYGAPGCALFAAAPVYLLVPINAAGRGQGLIDIPLDFTLAGVHFFNQFVISDPAANTLGFAVSNAGEGVIGN